MNPSATRPTLAFSAIVLLASSLVALAQQREVIPHAQDKPPGPPLAPAEAIKKMKVPQGFTVELVASEPDIVNPVAMTFDERGRIWITESLEYPRSEPGPGRDRVKVLEDTDGDGRADKFTVFADGLNIPSGIAVGHGGVWVANAPDILFMQDTDGDGKADRREVVVTGFGRADTHELPNSLTWGPDGWLYGLNGVFNPSRVEQDGRRYDFTCALFRIHPRTRRFELFAEGTSNPWGVAWDTEGSAFLSACVIDHLWHLVESGYYHRQGGPYPPFTWKMESIVEHKHQKAAYCGIHFFDSDAYPPQFRERLMMGNIHGNCINVDRLERRGATYFSHGEDDFLTANDAWFMPVVQKTGPDGCLYVLDWYDRYHCYQDARRDPAGIDRLKGRLYRVRYKDTPRAPQFDLAKESDAQLIERLKSPNVLFRDLAQRVLTERLAAVNGRREAAGDQGADAPRSPALARRIEQLVLDGRVPRKHRMHALWSLIGGGPLEGKFHAALLEHDDAGLRAWGVRAAGNAGQVDDAIRGRVERLAGDRSPDVQLQVAIAARKISGINPIPLWLDILSDCRDERIIPPVVWQNLHPTLEDRAGEFVALVTNGDAAGPSGKPPALAAVLPRAFDRIVARKQFDAPLVAKLLVAMIDGPRADADAARRCIGSVAGRIHNRELSGKDLAAARESLRPVLSRVLAVGPEGAVYIEAALLSNLLGDPAGRAAARAGFAAVTLPEQRRLLALDVLIALDDAETIDAVARALPDPKAGSVEFRGKMLAALGRSDSPRIANLVLAAFDRLEPELQPRAVELLTQRTVWAKPLLGAIGDKKIAATALNLNQVRRLLASKDEQLIKLVRAQWGIVREDRNPGREQVIEQVRSLVRKSPGDAHSGVAVFKKVCAQCHKMYGEGADVGPDITSNGRGSFEQLLSNVLDPSLVIGAAYQATIVATTDGRILTGLVAEDSPQRIVLKTQGGKLETIPRSAIDEMKLSALSMMPEDLEKQLTPKEIADLFAFLMLDKPPSDPSAKQLPSGPPAP
jgi:putative membrane-bound dehydrogenase-like protein